jgi:hypothetical protein
MALKITIGEVHKQHGSAQPEPTHFYHPWLKRVYKADLKLM